MRALAAPVLLGLSFAAALPAMGDAGAEKPDSAVICCMRLPGLATSLTVVKKASGQGKNAGARATKPAPRAGMKLIPGGTFAMGSVADGARPDEGPRHEVQLQPFWMDETDVTNAQFARFVQATHYITTAERKPDWNQLKQQLPPGTPKPPAAQLVAASLVFQATKAPVPLDDAGQWWHWKPGASWRQPSGPGSNLAGKDNFPVVQVSWDDAQAYARWAGKQLPTEAQWEFAARGGLVGKKYSWGDQDPAAGTTAGAKPRCNIWQGTFPVHDAGLDGFTGASPVRSFAPNGYGLYDMAGNVWQWCADWYRSDAYAIAASQSVTQNPAGPLKAFDPDAPSTPSRVLRGGSFLCNRQYCSSYRVSARMKSTADSATNHIGFRCVSPAQAGAQHSSPASMTVRAAHAITRQ